MSEPKEKLPIDDEARDDATWAEDQEKREYYYDDAHGYEVFVPEFEPEDEAEDG